MIRWVLFYIYPPIEMIQDKSNNNNKTTKIQMIEQQESRQLEGYSLKLILTSEKLIIRAIQEKTGDLCICEYTRGHLPHDVQLLFGSEEQFFDVLLTEQGIHVDGLDLKVPYIPRAKRPVKRELTLGLTKVELNEIQELKRKVAILERKTEEVSQMKLLIEKQASILENLEKRTFIYHYNPGVFRPLVLELENEQKYKIFGNILYRKPESKKNEYSGNSNQQRPTPSQYILRNGLISKQLIYQDSPIYSFKITIKEVPDDKETKAFIGVCTKYLARKKNQFGQEVGEEVQAFKLIAPNTTEQFGIFNPFSIREPSDNRIQKGLRTVSRYNCESFYRSYGIALKKGDSLVLTVNYIKMHMTWYRNEVSVERSSLEHYAEVYPLVYLEECVEAVVF